MKVNGILYFSSTGNSLYIAQKVKSALRGSIFYIPINLIFYLINYFVDFFIGFFERAFDVIFRNGKRQRKILGHPQKSIVYKNKKKKDRYINPNVDESQIGKDIK